MLVFILLFLLFIYVNINSAILSTPWSSFGNGNDNACASPYIGSDKNISNFEFHDLCTGSSATLAQTGAVVGNLGTIFYGSCFGWLFSVSPGGSEIAHFQTYTTLTNTPTLHPNGTLLFISTSTGYLYCFNVVNPAIFSTVWEVHFSTIKFDSSPTMSRDENYIVVTSSVGVVYYVSIENGAVLWTFNLEGSVVSTPAVDSDGSMYVIATNSSDYGSLYSISAVGVLNWKFVINAIVISSASIGPDGTVYFGSKAGVFYAIVYTTGKLKWKYTLPNGDYMKTATGINSNGSLFFGTHLGDVYSLHANGRLNWKFTTNKQSCFNQNLAIDILNNVYIGSTCSREFYSLNANGEVRWKYSSSLPVYGMAWFRTAPAISNNGSIIVGDGFENIVSIGNYPNEPEAFAPTYRPVIAPTQMPTMNFDVKFKCVQIIYGISATTFGSINTYTEALIYTIITQMGYVTYADVASFNFTSAKYGKAFAYQQEDASIELTYIVAVNPSNFDYNDLTEQLQKSISSKVFNRDMSYFGETYNALGLVNCTTNSVSITNLLASGSKQQPFVGSPGFIALIVFLCFFVPFFVGVYLLWHFKKFSFKSQYFETINENMDSIYIDLKNTVNNPVNYKLFEFSNNN